MSLLFVLVPTVLVLVFVAVIAYVWAARRGQFDDLVTPAIRMLHEEGDTPGPPDPGPRPPAGCDDPGLG